LRSAFDVEESDDISDAGGALVGVIDHGFDHVLRHFRVGECDQVVRGHVDAHIGFLDELDDRLVVHAGLGHANHVIDQRREQKDDTVSPRDGILGPCADFSSSSR
jgi:hypothetical protein